MRPKIFQTIGNRVYRFIARHRTRACTPESPQRPIPNWARVAGVALSSAAALCFIIYTFTWNLSGLPSMQQYVQMPQSLRFVAFRLGIDQYWAMFAPYPMLDDGWMIVEAHHADGSITDLLRNGAPIDYEKPKNVSALYPNERHRKYLMNLWGRDYARFRKYYLAHVCFEKTKIESDNPITAIELVYMVEYSAPPGQTSAAPERIFLERRDCS